MSLDDVITHPWIVSHVDKSAQSGVQSFNHMLQRADSMDQSVGEVASRMGAKCGEQNVMGHSCRILTTGLPATDRFCGFRAKAWEA